MVMKGETRPRATKYDSETYLFIEPARTFASLDDKEKHAVLWAYREAPMYSHHQRCIAAYICGAWIGLYHDREQRR